jgi:hypothetical protein
MGAAVGVERCTGGANLGDKGDEDEDEDKEPSSLEPRLGVAVGGCREMHLGNANLGDKGDEGREPSSLGMLNCRTISCGRQTKCTKHVAVVGTASKRCGWN